LLYSRTFHSLFLSFSRFEISCSALFLVQSFLKKFYLGHTTPAQWIILTPAAAYYLRDPQIPWVPIFLKRFLLLHATVAQLDTFLQAAAKFFPDPQSLRASSFGSPPRPAASFLPLRRFFRLLTDFTTASSFGW
jgi:hypothetical protein